MLDIYLSIKEIIKRIKQFYFYCLYKRKCNTFFLLSFERECIRVLKDLKRKEKTHISCGNVRKGLTPPPDSKSGFFWGHRNFFFLEREKFKVTYNP